MYAIQLCADDFNNVVAVFAVKKLAIEYAHHLVDCYRKKTIIGFPVAVEVLDGDTQILRLFI